MKTFFSFCAVLVTSFALIAATAGNAEAKRLGGGKSFGSKFSHSSDVKRSSTTSQKATAPSAAQQTNMAQKQKLASKGGLMGILGGLAIGGLLGALFFGGAFENINFMDILIFGALAFLLYKIFASRAQRQQPAAANGPADTEMNYNYQSGPASSATPEPEAAPASTNSFGGMTLDDLRGNIDRQFDKESFLEGSKSCYERLQESWNSGDLADIRQFTTDHVFSEIQDQYRSKTDDADTKIQSLNAELLSVKQIGDSMEASVLFNAELVENGENTTSSEVWHFTRPSGNISPTWYLDGIQQVN